MDRREFLATVGAGSGTVLSGCQTELSPSSGGPGSPSRTGTDPVRGFTCSATGLERVRLPFEEAALQWDRTTNENGSAVFALELDDRTYGRGDTAEVRLRNVSDRRQTTGTRGEIGVQVYTTGGWEEVRVAPRSDPPGSSDDGHLHPPETGFTWRLELTGADLVADLGYTDGVEVCPGPPAGRYRVVYWGVRGALAAEFDLRD